ncbi:hypothetical protein ACIQWN_23600 [Streptomyces vinaceus]|uniref:hypothetical protein n=1 Tax=Streptomyces vinaceus TaxID=1960 RepID=UPI0037FD4003
MSHGEFKNFSASEHEPIPAGNGLQRTEQEWVLVGEGPLIVETRTASVMVNEPSDWWRPKPDELEGAERILIENMEAREPLSTTNDVQSRDVLLKPAARKAVPGLGVLHLAVRVLPSEERRDWLEEQRGYLSDLPTRRRQWAWVLSQLWAMPRYAYTVRTGTDKETA